MNSLKKGYVFGTNFNNELNEESVLIENKFEKEVLIIPESEIVSKNGLTGLLNRVIDYVETGEVVEYTNELGESAKIKVASMTKAMPFKRESLLKQFADGEYLSGRITSIVNWGAYVSINGVSCVLRNCDFSVDATTVAHVHEVGDIIDGLTIRKVTDNARISIQKVVKYENPNNIDVSTLKKNDTVVGTIKNVKTFGCFVALKAPNLDALCSIPTTMEIQEGLAVKCVLTLVNLEKGKLKGKIVEVLPEIELF